MKTKKKVKQKKTADLDIGWREWAELPSLNIPSIKVKVDTGARTSALHAFNIVPFKRAGKKYVRFNVHPMQKDDEYSISCSARLIDERRIKSSNGAVEKRYVIASEFKLADRCWDIEISLTNRDIMSFRMLLGRQAMSGIRVVPKKSYLQSKKPKKG